MEKVLDDLGNDPYTGDIQKMKGGQNIWRRRVGFYRIIYQPSVDKRTIFILDIRRRTSKTYK